MRHGRYVQGGGCLSVGAAGGFLQGGGFGAWSKRYGVAAAALLEAEVVTVDGRVLVANACQHEDLFWALRGGGGGTFGIVTRVTLMTHPLPPSFGFLFGGVKAISDDAFRELIAELVQFYGSSLHDEHWGEQVAVTTDNQLRLSLSFVGLTAAQAERVWSPFRAWVEAHPDRYVWESRFIEVPAQRLWDETVLPDAAIVRDRREGGTGLFWWAGNQEEVGAYWYAYKARYVAESELTGEQARAFAEALFAASRHWKVELHFNKGQAGASADAIARGRATSMNPHVFDAAALVIIAAPGDPAGVERGEQARASVTAAMDALAPALPDIGAYANEADYFQPDWQRAFWGEHYPRLLEIKRKYDPDGVLRCHHCVGSDLPR